ncbi:pentapeptide repeat-containing protein [Aerococcus christensenii]|uniref:pentapeptide repeat-containing protein n=1 Tax=Aerococcus christensenii TaxID=87541 RepID=UPI0011AE626C|nr:pentapeptide repeat-containing protein [Aerococcus christensenii]
MDQTTLNEILRKHELWLKDDPNGERAHLKDADLRCADLRYANLRYADLRCADLKDADLKNADLRHAYLKGANLICADLRTANLEEADLKNADLKNADLDDAILRYADLRGANLKDAFLTQTISQNIQGQKVISFQVDTSRINNSISYWKDLNLWTTGCFQGTLEELQERVAETYKDNTFLREKYERVIAFILSEAEQNNKK